MLDLAISVRLCQACYDEDQPWIYRNNVLAFRGTCNAHEWILDTEFRLEEFAPGRVHHGFLKALKEHVSGGVLIPDDEFWVTGHSLGGPLAILAARAASAAGAKILGVHTFGSPRVGDEEFVNSIDFPVTRVVNHADPVPHCPPPIVYRHVGKPIWFDQDGRPHTRAGCPYPLNISDHSVAKYVALFEPAIAGKISDELATSKAA